MTKMLVLLSWFVLTLGADPIYGPFRSVGVARQCAIVAGTADAPTVVVRPAQGVDARRLAAVATYLPGWSEFGFGCPASGPGANHCEVR